MPQTFLIRFYDVRHGANRSLRLSTRRAADECERTLKANGSLYRDVERETRINTLRDRIVKIETEW